MTDRERIVKILNIFNEKYIKKGYELTEGQIELLAADILPLLEKRDKIIQTQEEYIELLGESEGNLAAFAYTHGINVSNEIVEKGKELRQKIEQLKKEIQ